MPLGRDVVTHHGYLPGYEAGSRNIPDIRDRPASAVEIMVTQISIVLGILDFTLPLH